MAPKRPTKDQISQTISSQKRAQDRLFRWIAGSPRLVIALLLALSVPLPALSEAPEPETAISHYDLDGKLGVQGYDPVAYFDRSAPVKGKKSISAAHNGVEYWFASEASRAKFQEAPDRYRPAYGGWCAWAMASGGKTQPDPENFIVADGRLFLFYKNFLIDTKTKWQEGDEAELKKRADGSWSGIVGAAAR